MSSEIDLKRTADQLDSSIEKRIKSKDENRPSDDLEVNESSIMSNVQMSTLDSEKKDFDKESVKKEEIDWSDYRNFRIKETDVGITQFVSNNRPFKCEIKQRYSDFIVHEINYDGQIIELTNEDIPKFETDDNVSINDEELLKLIPNEIREKLQALQDGDQINGNLILDVDDKDKNQRTKIHKFVSQFRALESLTVTIDDRKHIKVIRLPAKQKKQRQSTWPKNLPPYLHFSFYQENQGTQDSLAHLSKKLGINFKNIGYTGLKDKRAISTQQCSLYRVFPAQLVNFNKKAIEFKFPSYTGNYRFKDVPLFLGDAIGNRFDIVLRDVVYEFENDIHNAIKNVKENGFINYFGIQRFGHSEYPAHKVGIAIVKKEYKEAVEIVLRYRRKDIEPAPLSKLKKTFNECLRIYKENNDATKAFREFYWKSTNEGQLLKGLSLYGTNYLQAFSEIPRNNRSFYCHSFQSFIWNQIASYRFITYGLKLVKGDLVVKRKNLFGKQSDQTTIDQVGNNEGKEIDHQGDCSEQTNDNDLNQVNRPNDRVKLNYIREFEDEDVVVVDESNIEDYTIFDVVLPMIGVRVQNPENSVKDEIKRLLDELQIDEAKLSSVSEAFYMKGKYRRFMIKPIDLNYEIISYEDQTIRLFKTDLDKLRNVEHNVENAGTKKAIKLSFSLPSSTYATTLIREISRQNY